MISYKEKLEKLCLATGQLLNVNDRFVVSSLESKQSDLIAEIEAKKNLLQSLKDQDEAATAELEAEAENDAAYHDELRDTVEATKQKSKILEAYISAMSTEEFAINKINLEAKFHINEYWIKIKPLIESLRTIQTELCELKQLHQEYLDGAHKIDAEIESPH